MNTLHHWWSNFASLFRAEVEPEEILEQKIYTLEQQLVSLRQSVAQATSSLRKNEKLARDYQRLTIHWYRQAKIHLYHRKINLAREALETRRELHGLFLQLGNQIRGQGETIQAMQGNIEQLEGKIGEMKSYRNSFHSRSRAAEINHHLYEQVHFNTLEAMMTQWEDSLPSTAKLAGWAEESLHPYPDESLTLNANPMLNNIQQWLEAEPSQIKDVNIDQELENLQKDLDQLN